MDPASLAIIVTLLGSSYYIGAKLGNIESWLKNHLGGDGPHARLDASVAHLQRRLHRLEDHAADKHSNGNGVENG